jgi:threonine/homoserine/homoserine lactone efflux protein
VPHALGIAIGFGIMVIAVGLGLSSFLQAAPNLHTAIRYAGALYLLYLAWRIATAADGACSGCGEADQVPGSGALPARQPEGMGNLACLLSVAAWAAFGAAISHLLTPERARLFNLAMAALLVLSLVPVFL